MAAWAGFSEDDLKKVKQLSHPSNAERPKKPVESMKASSMGQDRRSAPRRPAQNVQNTSSVADTSMMLQKPNKSDLNQNYSSNKIPREKSQEDEPSVAGLSPAAATGEKLEEKEIKIEDLNDQEALSRDLMSLDKFQEQQKAIEEANKQKKALLSKTLTERKKKAQKEALKLEHIQGELSKLDHLLTADVQVIRNKIEDSSREFLEAQKRFQKAEVEYVASKMDLHTKSELKERFTEHLYTIIHQNEVRKARKLAELMKELEMECEEELQLPELPPLTLFHQSTAPLSPAEIQRFITKSTSPEQTENSSNINSHNDATLPHVIPVVESSSKGGDSSSPNSGIIAGSEQTVGSESSSTGKHKLEENETFKHSNEHISPVKNNSQQDENTPENIKVGQTSKLLCEMKEHINKELETVADLITKTDTNGPETQNDITSPITPSKWDFDGNI